MTRRRTVRNGMLVAGLALALSATEPRPGVAADPVASAAASTKTLRGSDGFRVRAPRGFRLAERQGAYVILGPRAELVLVAVRSDDSVRDVAQALLAQNAALPATTGDRFGLNVLLPGGKHGQVFFEAVPGGVAVLALAPRGRRSRLTAGDRRTLGRIARSARNVEPVTLPEQRVSVPEPAIALKPFTTADGSARAQVPDAPGWLAGGANGTVEGGHPELGAYAFGVPVPFLRPEYAPPGYQGVVAPFLPPREAVEQAWPVFIRTTGAVANNVRVVSEVPGSAGVLGPGMQSGMYEFTFDSSIGPARGFMIAGTFDSIDGYWYLYYSFIAVKVGAPGSVGDALLRTWQSWDPSADQARRQQQTFVTLQQTTQIIQSSNEYRRRVFEKTNANWSRYIRGQTPILDPVAPSAIGEGGQTLVSTSDGKFFDLSGNQFKRPGD